VPSITLLKSGLPDDFKGNKDDVYAAPNMGYMFMMMYYTVAATVAITLSAILQ